MYYVIQQNLFKEYHFKTLIEYLERYKLEYELIPWRPFSGKVEVKTNRKDVWFFGSIDDGIELQKHGWFPGIMYNERHDFGAYLEKYGDNMLNSDAKIRDFGWLPPKVKGSFFIRPTRDTKIFESKVWGSEEWNSYVDETRKNGVYVDIFNKTQYMYGSPKIIQQEIRCWIIDGVPVTMSQYKIGKRVNMMNMDNNEEAYIFSKNMAKIYSPSRVFVLDICLHEDEYKIVEINCANMSGFYDINMSKLIQSLENTFANVTI